MNTPLFSRVMLTLIATFLALHLLMEIEPNVAHAQSPLKIVKVQDYFSGPILGFSCIAANNTSACVILTR
jgi:hypothetical protein